jgi:hypothetical protein
MKLWSPEEHVPSALRTAKLVPTMRHTCLITAKDVLAMGEFMKKCTSGSFKFHLIQGLTIQGGHIISVLG